MTTNFWKLTVVTTTLNEGTYALITQMHSLM